MKWIFVEGFSKFLISTVSWHFFVFSIFLLILKILKTFLKVSKSVVRGFSLLYVLRWIKKKGLPKCTRQGHLSEMSFQGQIAVVGFYEKVF